MRVLTKHLHTLSFAAIGRIAVSAMAVAVATSLAAPSLVKAQSADLVLCDRLAADPADPDKPADVKGTPDVAPSDIATAIKYCRIAAGLVAARAVPARPRLCRQPANAGSDRRLAQGRRQGLDLGDGRTRRALRHRRRRRQGRSPGAQTVRARRPSRQSARRHQSCRALRRRCARRRIPRDPASFWRRPPRPIRKRNINWG